jgi:hypothetical protein
MAGRIKKLMAVKILRQAAQKFSLEIFVLYSILN